MIIIDFIGDSDFFCTLTDVQGLSPYYFFMLEHDETRKKYLVPVQIMQSSERGQNCRILNADKVQLESGKYLYKAFGTETEISDVSELENLEVIETGILVFNETRAEKQYFK